ncbi:exportin-4-like [Onthophagus taurus]|uniref:exportin-4-like n=1 Tax=Onthophagus taurus TaxID=166361 RepID=UPI000C1FFBEA|nr:exportin-4-like [Onthophagus taurus]
MSSEVIKELENAAAVVNAPPHLVTAEQRRIAENVFMDFRQSKSPYVICREILENSKIPFVLFEASEVLKRALIREWSFLQESDIISLRQYLMQYIISRDLPAFVQDRLLQVVCIMVKRASVDDFGQERGVILSEVESLIVSADPSKRILGCKLILNLMQEYAITVKSSDVGLSWEIHFKVKKQFEATDLKRIFKFSIHILSEIIQSDNLNDPQIVILTKYLLSIVEKILCWGFRSSPLPKKIIGVYETLFELDEAPCLRLGYEWKEIMLAPQLLPIIFQLYWKVRDNEELAHPALTSLVQLASLNGGIFKSEEDKNKYLLGYMENFLKLISSTSVKNEEALGLANLIKKLEVFFGKDIVQLPRAIHESYLDDLTRLTCTFSERMSMNTSELDKYYSESFDNMLEAWTEIIKDFSDEGSDLLVVCARRIFDTYLQCHLAPNDGFRNRSDNENVEEIEDNEDNDRIKFKDQLQSVGMLGRLVLDHSLPLLYQLLESRITKLGLHLQTMQSRPMTINESTNLDDLFEDIHWIILISGHVLCMESEGETPLIPSELNKFSITENERGITTVEDTLKTMASIHQNFTNEDFIVRCDKTIRIFCNVLRLCHMETTAAEVKLGHFMSPEVGCTLMWFLKRFCVHYLMPVEGFYDQISSVIVGALGRDTEGSAFVLNLVLTKIRANITHFNSEPILLQDTVDLFTEIVGVRLKTTVVVKSEGLWNLWAEQSRLDPGSLPVNIRRNLLRAFVLAGCSFTDKNHSLEYYQRILSPIQHSFKMLVTQERFNVTYQEENVRAELLDILECFIGTCRAAQMSTSKILFDFLSPILNELPKIVTLYKNYQIIVQAVLELFGYTGKFMLVYLEYEESKLFYENALSVVQAYSNVNLNKLTTQSQSLQEEGTLQDLDLILKLLTYVVSKDCLCCYEINPTDGTYVSAVDVVLYGLSFITPLITIDLLKHPTLCVQYYKLIVFTNDIYPEKICSTSEDFFDKLLLSIELGLTQFGSDVVHSCFDFLESLTVYLIRTKPQVPQIVYGKVSRFLKILFDLALTQQFNSDVIPSASTCIYSFICCYEGEYKVFVKNLIDSCLDTLVAERLAVAFMKLTENLPLNGERAPKLKFRDNFDKFITNVQGFLLVK